MHRLGLFGGTFNPIHHGHLLAAQAALEELGLDRILLILSGSPPLKGDAGLASGEHRLVMLEIPGQRVRRKLDAVFLPQLALNLGDRPVTGKPALTDPTEDIPADGPLG